MDAIQHLDEPGIGPSLADDSEDRPRDARRAMDVHSQFDQPRDHQLDLFLGGPFLHYYDHGFSALHIKNQLSTISFRGAADVRRAGLRH
jgi:hypothetical protein